PCRREDQIFGRKILLLQRQPNQESKRPILFNQRLFVFAWSIFELSISTFFAAVVEEDELQKILSIEYAEVLKCVTIKEGKEDKLKKILIKNNLAHVSINRKYNYLLKKVRGYGQSIIDDRASLEFY